MPISWKQLHCGGGDVTESVRSQMLNEEKFSLYGVGGSWRKNINLNPVGWVSEKSISLQKYFVIINH